MSPQALWNHFFVQNPFSFRKSCIFALTFSNFAYYMSRKQQKDVTLQKIWAR